MKNSSVSCLSQLEKDSQHHNRIIHSCFQHFYSSYCIADVSLNALQILTHFVHMIAMQSKFCHFKDKETQAQTVESLTQALTATNGHTGFGGVWL